MPGVSRWLALIIRIQKSASRPVKVVQRRWLINVILAVDGTTLSALLFFRLYMGCNNVSEGQKGAENHVAMLYENLT